MLKLTRSLHCLECNKKTDHIVIYVDPVKQDVSILRHVSDMDSINCIECMSVKEQKLIRAYLKKLMIIVKLTKPQQS